MNIKKVAALFALVAVAALTSPAGLSAQQSSPLKVRNKVMFKSFPFPLRDVRLLDGPFREAMLRDQKYLLNLDNDRLLHMFRVTAGLPSTAKPYGGWEGPDIELRGHSLGHFLSGCALMYASAGDERFKAKGDTMVAELAKIQQALAERGFNAGYLSAFPEEHFDRVDKRERVWAPYYTIHKTMAGLLDMYLFCDNKQALDVLLKKAAWVKFRVDRLSEDQQQAALQTEFGGMQEVLTNLYAVTGDPEHLRVARRFDHKRISDPLARGADTLDRLHANTQIPKAIGAARDYELTGEKRYHDVASFFWERVAKHRSYVIGGNSDDESFFPPETFSKHLGPTSAETCNTYNMLKLTRHLFAWEPSVDKMDFYERGLYNHILASQDPATGGFCYYAPLRPGAFKTFSSPEESFWCCVGTGMENHAKYPDTIYFHDDRSLYVNLFIASELKWKEKGLIVRQETRFPEEDTTRLSIKAEKAIKLALKIRYPSWAQSGITLAVNGMNQKINDKPGVYITIEREWKSGDVVQIRLPMSLRLEAMPDDPKMIALMYGPIALAGDLGRDGLQDARRYGPSAPQLGRVKPIEIPAFIGEVEDVLAKTKPAPVAPLTFKTDGLGRPHDVTLVPFYKIFEPRYAVYWKVYAPAEWEKRKADLVVAESRRKMIERLTVDVVNIDNQQSEGDHNLQGQGMIDGAFDGKRWRSTRNGWFSYELKTPPDKPVTLVCTYRGSEGRLRSFDVLVDGVQIATQTLEIHPGELFDFEYPLPEQLTRGKQRITVKFQSRPNALVGSVFDVRVAQLDPGQKSPQTTASPSLLTPDAPDMNSRAPERFNVRFETSKGVILIEIYRDWAPIGVDRFYNLVRAGYYDQVRFHRVIKGQWAQFGINGDPKVSNVWRARTIRDDPRRESNVRGTIAYAFATPNGRTTQVFINLRDNSATHDAEPFAPFGRVIEGMDVADKLYAEYGESAGGGIRAGKQGPLFEGGNAYLERDFPRLDHIIRATVVER